MNLQPNTILSQKKQKNNEKTHRYCSGGELFDHVVSRGSLSEREAAELFRQMVAVVHHCHTCGVVHRDIKPENFLLAAVGGETRLKACDFGLSAFHRPGQIHSGLVGSAYYIAP
jgi:calcium-dependent protein kinase